MTTSTLQQFRLPDVGEGLTEADVVAWHVDVGDVVEVNQVLVDIETAKSVVELPSPWAGRVVELLVPVGTTAAVGTPIITIGPLDAASPPDGGAAPAPVADVTPAGEEGDEPRLLVGYGAAETTSRRRRSARPTAGTAPSPTRPLTPARAVGHAELRARAKPVVRRLARALEVDLASVLATGPGDTVTREDVLAAARLGPGAGAGPAAPTPVVPPRPPAEGDVRTPVNGVRKQMAAAMVASAFTAPHVTEFVTLDVTRTLELRDQVAARREFRDVRVTPLALVARAFLRALERTPEACARWEEATREVVQPASVNLGIAAATPRGLLVPNIKAAETLSLLDLTRAINTLAATAREGRTTPAEMAGGTTTITNVGVFGVDTGTPILNPGETAILAVGAIRRMPWVVGTGAEERLEPRSVLQLALSFDHRVLDGAQGSQLLADTAALLTEPGLALL